MNMGGGSAKISIPPQDLKWNSPIRFRDMAKIIGFSFGKITLFIFCNLSYLR